MLLLAVVASAGLAMWRAYRRSQDPDIILSALFWLLIPGILGARAFYVIEYWEDQFWPAFAEGGLAALLGAVVNIAEGGLVVYGSIIGGTIGLIVFARRCKVPMLPLFDLLAPSLMLGLAIGRIGCLLNGCCYGGLCEQPWAVTFPRSEPPSYSPPYRAQVERGLMYGFAITGNPKRPPVVLWVKPDSPVEKAGLAVKDRITAINKYETPVAGVAHWALAEAFEKRWLLEIERAGAAPVVLPAAEVPPRSLPVHPTQVYSALNALLLCLVLLAYDRYAARRDGEVLALLMTLYPIARFILEVIRTDESALFFTGLSISQNVSLLVLLGTAVMWYYILRQPTGRTWTVG